MASLPTRVVDALKDATSVVNCRMSWLHQFEMTHRECLQLVAPPEHIDLLISATEWANVNTYESSMEVKIPATVDGVDHPEISLTMRTHAGQEPPIRPRAPRWRAAPPEVQLKAIKFAEHQLAVDRLTSLTKHIIEWMEDKCETGQQVRYLWPSIMHLCKLSGSEHVQRWVDKFGAYRAVKSAPHVPLYMRKAIQQTSELLTKAALLDEIKAPEEGEVAVCLVSRYTFWADEECTILLTRD